MESFLFGHIYLEFCVPLVFGCLIFFHKLMGFFCYNVTSLFIPFNFTSTPSIP